MILQIFFILLFSNNLYANQSVSDFSNLGSLLLFPLLFILMYFLLIRPQTKKANEHKNLISNLKIGDEIITQGGIVGKISKIIDNFIILNLNSDIDVIIKKDFILSALPKGTIKQIK